MIGQTIGSYRVEAKLGEGGMGVVYRAHDTKLGREVAIKVLPESVAADPERIARFEREARTLASLNHPNIGGIYGLEQGSAEPGSSSSGSATHARSLALVLELVEGPTLADRIAKAPIPLDEALGIARQIADALDAAHEAGVVHRDLKPANIKLRPDGTVKVLDFGLAKATTPMAEGSASQSVSPTITTPAQTQQGVVMGTAAYMSPEQAKGRPVDKRADIWAFGCVLFEMLTGSRPFGGDDVADTLAFVLTKEPDWDALPDTVPTSLHRLLRRCLARDVRQRLRDIGDARVELEALVESSGHSFDAAPPATPVDAVSATGPGRFSRMARVGGLVLLFSAVAGGFGYWFGHVPPDARVRRFEVLPRGTALVIGTGAGAGMNVAISPDGRQIVYVSAERNPQQLYVRSVDRLEPRVLTGLGSPQNPFISADGEWVGFLDGTDLKKVNIAGGPAVTIANVGATSLQGASWGADDRIIFATNAATGLLGVSAEGGDIETLTSPDLESGETAHRYPEFLPSERRVLFTVIDTSGAIDNAQVVALNLDTGERTVLVRGGGQARYVDSGHLVYGVGGELRAVAFDVDNLSTNGEPVRVVEDVLTIDVGGANFAVAGNGSLVYVAGAPIASRGRLAWVDRQGQEELLTPEARAYTHARISPDGSRIALDIREQQNDVWIFQIDGGTLTRLTVDPLLDRQPMWTPDGERIVFTSDRAGAANLFEISADGTGAAEPLTEGPGFPYATSFTPDGTGLVFWRSTPSTGIDLALLHVGDTRVEPIVETLLATPFDERNAEVSPDGRWIAYQSDESGQYEVYVQPFPALAGGRWPISSEGGTRPLWGPDGGELFYWVAPNRMMVVPVDAVEEGGPFSYGMPRLLFEGDYFQPLNSRTHDITPDGQRLLMIKRAGTGQASSEPTVVLVENWVEELKRLVPVN